MRLVFWQNCLSPHQLPYIVHLLDDKRVDEVVVVAEEAISVERKGMGWQLGNYTGLDKCKVYVNPHDKLIDSIFAERPTESFHFFGGIRGFAFVFKCLKFSLHYPVRRGMISERPNTFAFGRANGKPLWLHRIRFFLQDRRYAKHIDTVFAMGEKAVDYFRKVNRDWTVHPFMYCTQSSERSFPVGQTGPAKFIFVGSLSYRKSPLAISCALARSVRWDKSLRGGVIFVGDGPLRKEMETFDKKHGIEDMVTMAGFQPQNEVPKWLAGSDILILPSIYDGWGAVVNEALQAGLYVICSDACGASDLLKEDERLGKVFHKGNVNQLGEIMTYCMRNIGSIRQNRSYRLNWAEGHISGQVVAKYFVDCISASR